MQVDRQVDNYLGIQARRHVCIAVVKLPSKRWWIPIGARSEGPRAEVGFTTADHGLSSIQGTLFGFYGCYGF